MVGEWLLKTIASATLTIYVSFWPQAGMKMISVRDIEIAAAPRRRVSIITLF